jgi:hypothetical protein
MDPTGGATTVAVADMKAWSLSMEREQADVTAFNDTVKQYVLGLPDCQGTYEAWWTSASSPALFDVAQGTTAVTLDLIPSTTEPTFFFTGLAYLDASIDVGMDGGISISGKFVAAGPWTLEGTP